jgi:hypothetical protein
VNARLEELRDSRCVELVVVTRDHHRHGAQQGRPPREHPLTNEGWIVGLQQFMIQNFRANPTDLFEINDIVTENWV